MKTLAVLLFLLSLICLIITPFAWIGVIFSVFMFVYKIKLNIEEKKRKEEALKQLEIYNIACQNSPLSVISQNDIILPDDEVCYYNRTGSWSASKMVVKAINYVGSRYKYGVGKHLSFNIGSMKPVAINMELLISCIHARN